MRGVCMSVRGVGGGGGFVLLGDDFDWDVH